MKFLRKPLCTTFHFLIFRVFHSIHLSLCWLFFSTFSLPLSSVSLICFLHSLLLSLPPSYSPSLPVTGLSTSFTTSILFSFTSSYWTLYVILLSFPCWYYFTQTVWQTDLSWYLPIIVRYIQECQVQDPLNFTDFRFENHSDSFLILLVLPITILYCSNGFSSDRQQMHKLIGLQHRYGYW